MTKSRHTTPYPFEIHHGPSVITIDDDWSGHILIEQIYEGLRKARHERDTRRRPLAAPAPGSQAENAMMEAAMVHGFQWLDADGAYRATASQIAALMTAAREQGRVDALRAVESEGCGGAA